MGVLQQRRRPYGYRTLRGIEESEEVAYQGVRQLRLEECLKYLIVRGIAQCDLVEVVLLHEIVEDVCTEDDGLRYLYGGSRISVEVWVRLYYMVKERQATSFSTKRALSDACEVRILVEFLPIEDRHYTLIAHPAVFHYGIEDYLTVDVDILELMPRNVLKKLRYREDGTRR